MRWTIRIVILLLAPWVAYAASPFWAVYDFANALQQRDTAAVARRVNFPAVRRSLTEQVVVTYLQLTGKDARLGQFGRGMAVGAAMSIADPVVAKLLSTEVLIDLLQKPGPAAGPADGASIQGMTIGSGSGLLGNLWQVFIHSEQGLRSFAVTVPFTAPPPLQFRLVFRLTSWTWKLSAIELPEEVRGRLAQELIKQTEGK